MKVQAVGMGTLAGSTIMLLTIPWSASLVIARTDLKHGESVDGQLTAPLSKGTKLPPATGNV